MESSRIFVGRMLDMSAAASRSRPALYLDMKKVFDFFPSVQDVCSDSSPF